MKPIIQRLKSKTYWLGIGVMLLGYLQQYGDQLQQVVPAKYQPIVMLGVGAVICILREVTTKPLIEK